MPDTRSKLPAILHNLSREKLGDRAFGIIIAVVLELLLLVALLSLGMYSMEEEPEFVELTTFDARNSSAEEPAEQSDADAQEVPQPQESQQEVEPETPVTPDQTPPVPRLQPVPPPAAVIPVTPAPAPPAPAPVRPDAPRAVIREDRNYGPANTGARGGSDTPIVGTAPDGSPLYGASWFVEPSHQEMAGYLSTVEPPAWTLIACKTAPRWEVVDCVGLEQYPPNSNIQQAILAAAWQFQVRPPRRGGRSLVGSWVRIRFVYSRGSR